MGTDFSDGRRDAVEKQLRAILASRHFANAPIVCAFLQFVVNESVAGRGDRIKAYTIATGALGRNTEFDPANDTIVRTTAGRVRKALQTYYRECGPDFGVLIDLPKGKYDPSFEFRDEPSSPHGSSTGWLTAFRQRSSLTRLSMILGLLVVLALGYASFAWQGDEQRPLPDSVVIDVRPLESAGHMQQSLVREIETRLPLALSKIGLAEISPPDSSPHPGKRNIPFILKTSVTDGDAPAWIWQLLDAESGNLLWASSEPLQGASSVSIDRAVDKVAFQILGMGGAVPSSLEKYRGDIFSRATCLFRAQITESIESNIAYPRIRDCLERVIARSPGDAPAWGVLSTFYTYRSHFYASGTREERAALVERAERAAEKAAELAPEAYLTKVALMHLALRKGQFAEFEALQQEIQRKYPGDIYLQIRIATRLARLGHGREALELFDRAQNEFGINLKNWAPGIAVAYYGEGKYQEAYGQILRTTSDLRFVLVLKAAILGKLDMKEQAATTVEKLLATNPDIKETFYEWLIDLGWAGPLVVDIGDGLTKAGLAVRTGPATAYDNTAPVFERR